MQESNRITIPVMHCFDNNYVIPAAASFYSMLEHADPQYDYHLYVLHSDITVQNQRKLTRLVENFSYANLSFVEMGHRFNDVWNAMPNTDHLSKEVLYKLLLAEIFPQYDKMIITDVDVVFLGDISPSYFAIRHDSEEYFAGVRQVNPDKTFLRDYYRNYERIFGIMGYNQLKVCGGYLVANLKKQREDGIQRAFVSYLKNDGTRLLQAEQDVINFCCKDHQISYLPLNYVTCSYMYDVFQDDGACCTDPYYSYIQIKDAMEHPIQLHYATQTKPWNARSSTKAEIWYDYLNRTEFAEDFYKIEAARSEKNAKNDFPGRNFLHANPDPEIKVSVVCCTYNHEQFIDKALNGILNQKTDFRFEVIVADDCSTDATQSIIRKWQAEYPEQMGKCILRTINVGIGQNYYEAFSLVCGEYMAICDGDDCWTDEYKLQKQVDFLDEHSDYSMVCSNAVYHHVDDSTEDTVFDVHKYVRPIVKHGGAMDLHDLILGRFIPSVTLMVRWVLHNAVPEFLRSYSVIDFPIELIHASTGYIGIMEDVTAQYNIHSKSISHSETENVGMIANSVIREVNQMLEFTITKEQDEFYMLLNPAKEKVRTPAKDDVKPTVELVGIKRHGRIYNKLHTYYMSSPGWVQKFWRRIKHFVKNNHFIGL